jgi:hypothetical protein
MSITGRRWCSLGAFWIWAAILFVAGTSLAAAHFALPKPDAKNQALAHALSSLRSQSDEQKWLAVHVLYAQCRCSRNILEHLAASRRPAAFSEKVLIVGERPELNPLLRRMSDRGMDVRRTTVAELQSKFHVEAAPLLLVVDPRGNVRYSGGYTERKQGPDVRDAEIMTRLAREQTVAELPLFGCAVSEKLRKLLDPLELKALTSR